MPINPSNVADWFNYHAPDDSQRRKFEDIRTACTQAAQVILANTPVCADQQAALRKLKEALMTANSAVATGGVV